MSRLRCAPLDMTECSPSATFLRMGAGAATIFRPHPGNVCGYVLWGEQARFVMLNEVKHLGSAGKAPAASNSTYKSMTRDPSLTLRMTESVGEIVLYSVGATHEIQAHAG